MQPTNVPQRPAKRSPARKGSGLAQQSLVEHALSPLDVAHSLQPGIMHQVRYHFTDKHRNRKTATANVACPFGLSPNDELYLYGLLALTFAQPEPTADFYATPHWCLKQLGMVDANQEQGTRYQLFRDAIRRLAGVVYENDNFYDPLRAEHRQVAFGLLKYSLPLDDTSSRTWHFVWDAQWFRFCEAIAGSFTFDFNTYRQFDVASRRMFLLLSKMFWRSDHSPSFELRQLGVSTLGFAESLATKEIKQKLIRICQTLLDHEIISLPSGLETVRDLFTKRAKGLHVVQFSRGKYFERGTQPLVTFTPEESPLVEPLEKIGFDRATVRRILGEFSHRLIAEWADITLAAVERKLIKESPPAYFQHYIRKAKAEHTTPPDWWRNLQKQERVKQLDRPERSASDSEQTAFQKYLHTEARDAFERVTDKLFQQLHADGQDETEARSNADRFARVHFTRQFRTDHPEFGSDGSASLSQLLEQRSPQLL
jgi:hypothetical protein